MTDLQPDLYLLSPTAGALVRFPRIGKSPAEAWRALSELEGGQFVLMTLQGAEVTPQAMAATSKLTQAGRSAAFGGVREPGGQIRFNGARADAVRYAQTLPGSLIVSSRLAGALAARLTGRVWDDYWACDLAALTAELCDPLSLREVFCTTPKAAPPQTLLPLVRAGFRPFGSADPTVVVYGACDASAMLYFDAFSRCTGLNLRFLRPTTALGDLPWLVSASAVILMRNIEWPLKSGLIEMLRDLAIPVHWFVDDDLTVLADEGSRSLAFFGGHRLAAKEGLFDGLLVSTERLGPTFALRWGLDPARIRVLPPRVARHWPEAPRSGSGIALIGGAFRGEALRTTLPQALAELGAPCRVIASDNLRPFIGGLPVEWEAFEPDFLTFLHRWQRRAPTVLLHPPGQTRNLANKSLATLLVAHVLGAVPLVADEPAYAGWTEADGVLKLPDGRWSDALRQGLDPERAQDLRARLTVALTPLHLAAPKARDLLDLIGRPSPVDPLLASERLSRALSDRPRALTLQAAPPPRPLWRRVAGGIKRRVLAF